MLRPTPELVDKYIRPLNSGLIGTLSYSDPETGLALLVPDLVARGAQERRLQDQQEGVVDDVRRVRRLLRPADDEPRLQGLRRPLGVRRRQGVLRGAALALGRARPARQPVGRDRVHRGRDPRHADRRARRRRRDLERRGRRPVVPDRLLVGLERARARARSTSPSATRRARSTSTSGMRVADYPTIQDYVGQAVMETNAVADLRPRRSPARSTARPRTTLVILEPGVLARGNFLHWAWQIKFIAAQNIAEGRRQDAPRVRRLRLQAGHGARALPARRQGRLGDGADERGAAPVRRQGRPARVRRRSTTGTSRTTGARSRTRSRSSTQRASASSPSSSWPRPRRRRRRSRRRRRRVSDRRRAPAPPRSRARPSRSLARAAPRAPRRGDRARARAGRPAHRPRPRRRPARRGHGRRSPGEAFEGARARIRDGAGDGASRARSLVARDGDAAIVPRVAARGVDPTRRDARPCSSAPPRRPARR